MKALNGAQVPGLRAAWAAEGGLAALWVLANGVNGLSYRPQLDDWFYIGRAATWACGAPWGLYLAHYLYASRPLSFMADVMLWSRFWPHLAVPWAFMLAVMFVTAILTRRLVQSLTGQPFWWGTAAILFFPGAVEGQDWLVGSTGIVAMLFFGVLGFWALVLALRAVSRRRTWIWVGAAFLAFLVSDLCYEQAWFVVAALLLLFGWVNRRRFWQIVAPGAAALAATAGWYLAHRAEMAANGHVAVHSLAEALTELRLVVPQVVALWTVILKAATHESLIVWRVSGWWWAAALPLAALTGWAVARAARRAPEGPGWSWVAVGVAVWGLSYFTWLLAQYGWVSTRSMALAAFGAAAVLEGLLMLARRAWPGRDAVAAATGFLLAVALLMGANLRAQDLVAYRASGRLDASLASRTLAILNAHHIKSGVLVTSFSPLTWVPWDYFYHNHIQDNWSAPSGIQFMLEDMSHGHNRYVVMFPSPAAHEDRAVGLVAVTTPPKAQDLSMAGATSGIVLEVRYGGLHPSLVRAVWYGPTVQPVDRSGPPLSCVLGP
ncbi:MAG: hypothetical protein M0Z54_14465 [Thermaerobacter sp.]|nr:hypothetical protein [Thermaerobacter sp.]